MAFPRRKKLTPEEAAAKKIAAAEERRVKAAAKRAEKKAAGPQPPRVPAPEEDMPDGTVLCEFTISGRPATKKTHQNIAYIGGRPRVLPSAQYTQYSKVCEKPCKAAWADQGKQPIDCGVILQMRIVLDSWAGVGDHVGYLQSLCDILQEHGVLADDKWVTCGDDACCPPLPQHWLGYPEKDCPRAEIRIIRFRHPFEDYRREKEAADKATQERVEARAAKAAAKAVSPS